MRPETTWRAAAFAATLGGIAIVAASGIVQGEESTVASAGLLLFIYGLFLTWIGRSE